jgi:hypothetical protein
MGCPRVPDPRVLRMRLMPCSLLPLSPLRLLEHSHGGRALSNPSDRVREKVACPFFSRCAIGLTDNMHIASCRLVLSLHGQGRVLDQPAAGPDGHQPRRQEAQRGVREAVPGGGRTAAGVEGFPPCQRAASNDLSGPGAIVVVLVLDVLLFRWPGRPFVQLAITTLLRSRRSQHRKRPRVRCRGLLMRSSAAKSSCSGCVPRGILRSEVQCRWQCPDVRERAWWNQASFQSFSEVAMSLVDLIHLKSVTT